MTTLYILDLEDEDDNAFYQYLSGIEINIISMNLNSNIDYEIEAKPTNHIAAIKVTIHIPNYIRPGIKQQKINQIYDILKPKTNHGGRSHEKDNRNLCTAFC